MIGDILVTGATGFFGRHFVKRLLDQNLSHRICIYSRDEFKQFQMRQQFKDDPRLRWFVGDVRDRDRLLTATQGIACVVHAAALKRIEVGRYNPMEMVKTNVIGSMNVVEACQHAGVKRAVLLSSDKAFEPISPYGQSKALAESLFISGNETGGRDSTRFVVTRYGNVAGSTGSVIPLWRAADRIRVTHQDATRFWMTADEAVELVLAAVTNQSTRSFYIPTLPAFRLGDLLSAMDVHEFDTVGLPPWEKKNETLAPGQSSDKARRMTVDEIKEALRNVP